MPSGDDGASSGRIHYKEDERRDAQCDTDGASSRRIAEKTGRPGLVMKVTNRSRDALFAKRTGVVTPCCGEQLDRAPRFARKYTYSNVQSLTEWDRACPSVNEQETEQL